MVNSKCCVPFCATGYTAVRDMNRIIGVRNLSLFAFPKSRELFLKWKNKIKLERDVTEKDYVCEKHFDGQVIIKHDSITLKDGNVCNLPRKIFVLKPGAIPTIFPRYPSYSKNTTVKIRKSPVKREILPAVRKKTCFTAEDVDAINDVAEDVDTINDINLVDAHEDLNTDAISVPENISAWKSVKEGDSTIYFLLDEDFNMKRRVIVSDKTSSIQIYVGLVQLNHNFEVGEENNISHILQSIYDMKVCPGAEPKVLTCQGFLSKRSKRCFKCDRYNRRTNRQFPINRRMSVMIKRNDNLKKEIIANRANSRKVVSIESLPEVQQEVVRAFLNTKVSNPRNNRYTRQWMYECILLKVKCLNTYKRLRQRRVLPLPSPGTVQSYIRKLKASFGFQPKVFELLRRKAHSMDPRQRRGVLLIDEMKLAPSIKFDKNKLEFIGFTDIGKYTPEEQKDEPGDHALVILYQPFEGSWIQAVGAFLSRSAASGHVLSQIVLEAVVSIENSGFYIDCVTTDGATWNRNMWDRFGVSEEKPYCEHLVDDKRRLYFVSDFPHLIKNLWMWIVNKGFIVTPDGIVNLVYWKAVVDFEKVKPIKAYAALNKSHVDPKQYEKMSVGRAYQFFSKQTASAMQFYRKRAEMKGYEGTVKFINRIANLIHAFNSRNGKSALRKYDTPERQTILNFIEYLGKCPHLCSESGIKGLKVTCTVAIELSDFLLLQNDYQFVMLTRLNQDNLERFFGMVRAFCGNNDHPDPQMFLLIFRLMMVYSLVKPVVGSNVTGDELFATLIEDSELEVECDSNKNRWNRINEVISNAAEELRNIESTGNMNLDEDQRLLEFLAGYVGMKASKLRDCALCARTLSVPKSEYQHSASAQSQDSENAESTPSLLELRDYHNALHYPTKSLFQLVTVLEENVRAVIGDNVTNVRPDTFFEISERLETLPFLPRVGCEEHKSSLFGYVVQFYLILRMHFAAKAVNSNISQRKKNAELRKMGKLIQGSGKSNTTAKALVQKIDSYCTDIEAVMANMDIEALVANVGAEMNREDSPTVPEPKPAVRRSRKSRKPSGEVLASMLESFAQTIEEVVANFSL